MKYYMCGNCLSVFRSDEQLSECPHPSCGCLGSLVEVDEPILPAVHVLNKKGYETVWSCSGHYLSSVRRTYIEFAPNVKLPYLPKGFRYEEVGSNIIEATDSCVKGFDEPVTEQDMLIVYQNISLLLEWAIELPEVNKE